MRVSRAKVGASSRSSFRLLSVISFTCLGLATTVSCPNSCSKRLTQGEWVPTSMAIRARPQEPNLSTTALLVVTCPSRRISPSLLSMQYRLVLSPRSIPIVTDCCAPLAFTAAFGFCRELLSFFMAGLLCTSSAYLGAYRIPWEPAFSLENKQLLAPFKQRCRPLR